MCPTVPDAPYRQNLLELYEDAVEILWRWKYFLAVTLVTCLVDRWGGPAIKTVSDRDRSTVLSRWGRQACHLNPFSTIFKIVCVISWSFGEISLRGMVGEGFTTNDGIHEEAMICCLAVHRCEDE